MEGYEEMMRKGWRGQSYRHSLAARGIKTNNVYMKGKMASMAKSLMDDGSNREKHIETPDFQVENKLTFANTVREEANQDLLAAQDRGDVSFAQIEDFWDNDFKQEFNDFKERRFTAEQFQQNVRTKVKRVTTPVPVMGVSDQDHGSLIPKKEDSF
jgi:hypothetical protein